METSLRPFKRSLRNWWAYELLGAFLFLMSVLVFSFPLASYAGLMFYFAFSFLTSGVLRIVFALSNKEVLHWRWYLFGGVLDILIGVYLLANPGITATVLPYFVGFYFLVGGIAAISKSNDLHSLGIKGNRTLMFFGVLSVLLSVLILFNPVLGIFTVITATGMGFLMLGLFYIVLGFKIRSLNTSIGQGITGRAEVWSE